MNAPNIPGIGNLSALPVWDHLNLVAAPVRESLETLKTTNPWTASQIFVCEVPEQLADTEALTEEYGMNLELSVNCILVGGKRAGEERIAACAVRANTRADVNRQVKQLLDVRKASFLSQEQAVAESDMEYGGITPIGLPTRWRILVDERAASGWCCIGSGLRRSKLFVTGEVLTVLPGAEVIPGLAVEM